MIASGGTAKEAETLADEFQELLVDVMLEQREVKKENDIIKARALPTAKPKEPANLPNEFKTNDDFCPGCGLELRSMSTERTALWTRRVRREPRRRRVRPGKPARAGPAALHAAGVSSSGSAPIAARCIEALRKDIEAMEKALPPKYAYVHGVRDRREAGEPEGAPARQPDAPRRHGAARLPLGAEPGRARRRSRRAAAGSSWRATIAAQPIAMRVIVNRVWKEHFGTGLVNTPSNFGVNGERPTPSGAARLPGAVLRRPRHVDQGAASRDHAQRTSIS